MKKINQVHMCDEYSHISVVINIVYQTENGSGWINVPLQ